MRPWPRWPATPPSALLMRRPGTATMPCTGSGPCVPLPCHSLMHPHRSQEAFAALIEDGQGIVVSDGDGVYQGWVQHRQTCLAHRIRTARGLAEKSDPHLAACGQWALTALQT